MDTEDQVPGRDSKLASGPYKRIARLVLRILNEKGIYDQVGMGSMPKVGYLTVNEFADKHQLGSQTLWGLLWGRNVPKKRWLADFAKTTGLTDEETDLLYLLAESDREITRSEVVSHRFDRFARSIAPDAYRRLIEQGKYDGDE